ncbi:MAG: hypothetical protein HZB51_09900 [Chloroflexi bacterium]|nr:hypothetical protein [Chloroflexota bacterium]
MLAPYQDQIATLTRINIQDMVDNFGLSGLRYGRRVIERAFWSPAHIFARQMAQFDRRIGEIGLAAAAHELLLRYVNRVEIIGAENVSRTGGVVLAANHPGMMDTLACFSTIPRTDLHIVSADREFVRALPNIARRSFWVSDDLRERLTVVRQVSRFLQTDGAVLICPAGQIEPDPATMPGAIESLTRWSDSLGMFVRLAPQCVVVPTVISSVVYAPALHNPLARLRRDQKSRERAAATIQAFLHTIGYLRSRMRVRIEFGAPLSAADLIELGNAAAITKAISESVKQLILRHGGLGSQPSNGVGAITVGQIGNLPLHLPGGLQ